MENIKQVLIERITGKKEYKCDICEKWNTHICQGVSLCSKICSDIFWDKKRKANNV